MIDLTGMISIPFLKKTVFTGSYLGMNYRIKKVSDEEQGDRIQATAWPGPFNFATTDDEKKVSHEVPFSEDGIREAVVWLNAHHAEHYKK